MKDVLILHGLSGSSSQNWFSWLEKRLKHLGNSVWNPNLPSSEKPNWKRYYNFILKNKDWKFSGDSILVGHSAGAVSILGILQMLPGHIVVDTCYLIAPFKNDLGWDELKELFITPFDFKYIKTKAKKFVIIHSDNDPYCPLEHAEFIREKLGAELIIVPDQQHFSIGKGGEKYKEFPFLLEAIKHNGYSGVVHSFLNKNQLMSISTNGDYPWIANVYYAVDDQLNFYFLSKPTRIHSQHIEKNKNVAIAVIDSHQTPQQMKEFKKTGIQLYGEASLLTQEEEIRNAVNIWKKVLGISANRSFSYEHMMEGKIDERMYKVMPNQIKMFNEELFDEDEVPMLKLQ